MLPVDKHQRKVAQQEEQKQQLKQGIGMMFGHD